MLVKYSQEHFERYSIKLLANAESGRVTLANHKKKKVHENCLVHENIVFFIKKYHTLTIRCNEIS